MYRVCYPMTHVPEHLIATITVPEGNLYAGDVVIVNTIDNQIVKNFTQYSGTLPTTALLKDEALGIVISGGNYEELTDGRLPEGNANYASDPYIAGKTAPVLLLEPRVIFYISDECLGETEALSGQYLYGQNESNTLAIGNSKPEDILTVIKVQAKLPFRVGDMFGGEFVNGNVCYVLPYNKTASVPVTTYTVSFDTDGGSSVASQTVEEGGKATKPSDPTKAGYAFDDWYAENTYTTVFDFNTEIEENTTIYGKFLEVFTVTFNSNGGSAVTSQDVVDGGKATRPTDPTKENATFAGWYKEDTFVTEFDFDTDIITADTTIYAKWE